MVGKFGAKVRANYLRAASSNSHSTFQGCTPPVAPPLISNSGRRRQLPDREGGRSSIIRAYFQKREIKEDLQGIGCAVVGSGR